MIHADEVPHRAVQVDKITRRPLAFPHLYVTQVTWSSIFRVRVCTNVRCFLQATQKAHIILLRLIITATISTTVQLTYKTKAKQKTCFLVNIPPFNECTLHIYANVFLWSHTSVPISLNCKALTLFYIYIYNCAEVSTIWMQVSCCKAVFELVSLRNGTQLLNLWNHVEQSHAHISLLLLLINWYKFTHSVMTLTGFEQDLTKQVLSMWRC